MTFTRKEGSDDTRDVVSQRAVHLPYLSQARQVTGGTLTTDKASNGVGGSWTRVVFEPDEVEETGETFITVECQRSYSKAEDRSRTKNDSQHLGVRQILTNKVLEFIKVVNTSARMITFQQRQTTNPDDGGLMSTRDVDQNVAKVNGVHVAQNFFAYMTYFRISNTIANSALLFNLTLMRADRRSSITISRNQTRIRGSLISGSGDTAQYNVQAIQNGYLSGHFSSLTKGYAVNDKVTFGHTSVGRYGDVASRSNRSRSVFTKLALTTVGGTISSHIIYNGPPGSSQLNADVCMVSRTNYFAVVFLNNSQTNPANNNILGPYQPPIFYVDAPLCFWSTDAGVTWIEIQSPPWDFTNYYNEQARPEDIYTLGNSSYLSHIDKSTTSPDYAGYSYGFIGYIAQNTHSVPLTRNSAFIATLLYRDDNSAQGGVYVIGEMSATGYVSLGEIPIMGYKYTLANICRPKNAVVMTFLPNHDLRAYGSASLPWKDALSGREVKLGNGYPPDAHMFDGIDTSTGYANKTKLAIYKKKSADEWELILRDLPWPRTHASGHVFCATNDLLGTIVRAYSAKHGRDVNRLFTSKDLGLTWKQSVVVDHLSDLPADVFGNDRTDASALVTSWVPPKYASYVVADVIPQPAAPGTTRLRKQYSHPPMNMLGSSVNGVATVPHPGAPWLYT